MLSYSGLTPPSSSTFLITYLPSGVVGALYQLQRERKKHSAHLATIRAQGMSSHTVKVNLTWSLSKVRKNAEAHNDPLGPRWPTFVSKAVRTLVSFSSLKVKS